MLSVRVSYLRRACAQRFWKPRIKAKTVDRPINANAADSADQDQLRQPLDACVPALCCRA